MMRPVSLSDTREIALTKGYVAIVDAADFDWLNQWKWHAMKCGRHIYARRTHWTGTHSRHVVYMHRLILDVEPGMVGDHINGDTLDCRRENLRSCTQAENSRNRTVKWDAAAGLKGVHKSSPNRWSAVIRIGDDTRHLGSFKSPELAARAYDAAAAELHGAFARPNFPEAA